MSREAKIWCISNISAAIIVMVLLLTRPTECTEDNLIGEEIISYMQTLGHGQDFEESDME
jgi:hypothetical protein